MNRRRFLKASSLAGLGILAGERQATAARANDAKLITLFLTGDVMTGRGVDQILPHPSDPRLYEPYIRSALGYVELAERVNDKIPRPVDFAYVWGDALDELARGTPDVRIINLETAVTKSNDYWKGKDIHYRMHPLNVACLTAAGIDCCVLANNHVLDWGYAGLDETLATLRQAGMQTVGAGRHLAEAQSPVVMPVPGKGRVLLFAFGSGDAGVPVDWAASDTTPGVNRLQDWSDQTVRAIAAQVHAVKRPGDIVVASIHWGSNWGYRISPAHTEFAHRLIDTAGVDVIHGHSSHHVKGIEVYKHRPILYGCGDFINDYEGIGGYERFRAELGLMYFVTMNPATGELAQLSLTPTRIKRLQVHRAASADAKWLADVLNREGRRLATRFQLSNPGTGYSILLRGPAT